MVVFQMKNIKLVKEILDFINRNIDFRQKQVILLLYTVDQTSCQALIKESMFSRTIV